MSSGMRVPPTVKPTNYVAGLGRGAVGFTTRSDIGPAREAPGRGGQLPGQLPPGQQGPQAPMPPPAAREMGGSADLNERNFDKFEGYGGALFNDASYENDDVEADRIYEAIDERMDSRRKRAREEKLIETMKKYREERPKISDQFADLKRELKDVSREEWEGIPDIGDHSLRLKQKKRPDKITPMTDNMLDSMRSASEAGGAAGALDARQQQYGGFETPMGGGARTPHGGWRTPMLAGGIASVAGTSSSLTSGLAAARGTVLGLKLDKMSDSVTGQTVVDPKGYLTDLNSIKVNTASEVGDIKKARLLLKSVTTTNPKHAPGWIAAARVEEIAGKAIAARKLIKLGCDTCPESEDVWLEAARLQSGDANARSMLALAVGKLPTSTKLWLRAAELEPDPLRKKTVLRKALELVPSSVKLWRTAIELEDVEDARIMLGRAVECVPHSVDMWLALARLETYENARRVLNQAREAIPTEPAIWLTAAKLEEAHGNGAQLVDRIVAKAVASLAQYQVVIDREQWLKEAEAAELAAAPLTCGAIVRHTIGIGVENEDRKRTWLDDADACASRSAVETARAVYAHALATFPNKKAIWLRACALEKKHGTRELLEATLRKAVQHCPQAEVLWLMAAKEKWLGGDVEGARQTLMDAFATNPDSEQVWLAAVKLEWENDERDRARVLLARARDRAPSPRVWMKAALLERECHDYDAELRLLDEALDKYATFAKFYLMAGQACERDLSKQEEKAARDFYARGLRRCPKSSALWRAAAALEEAAIGATKARSILELARLKNGKTPDLWLAAVRLERRHGNRKLAENLSAKALQECPESGELWADEIFAAPRPARKGKSLEALKRCDNNAHVIVAVSKLFVAEQKRAKARKWFTRACALDPDLGDAWAHYYAFELADGVESDQEDVLQRCVAAEPAHGELWTSISKDPAHARADVAAKLRLAAAKIRASEDAT
ncbi:hypothetical protein AURANDRAFT_38946 [Aureococcus anophagefferens]|uniref:PRP1 splicing factor N-terminal domain-containing protein n=1 Tax=Aureococcus anophagefferens TaxID=44056 RepID=F0YJY9_AURAN|nr:hypothetical protein AURANDRAFT_38946 [Aureococcus anophagefferens]EGB04589.1 hypothetical protein AURANDRAFT_38946 [Aureococcus anophagefferens]|eukprot:XP_009040696.1 hypothetical protein AURANDRAFT_38946 [Aureococcus anophagefferens]